MKKIFFRVNFILLLGLFLNINSLPLAYSQITPSLDQDEDLKQIMGIYNDLIACYKAAIIEQGGEGLWHAWLGQIAMGLDRLGLGLDHTGSIRQYPHARRMATLSYLSYRGITPNENDPSFKAAYKEFYDRIPGLSDSHEQAAAFFTQRIMDLYLETPANSKRQWTPEERQTLEDTIAAKIREIRPAVEPGLR